MSPAPPLISVVIPTHNRLKLVMRALQSVHDQTYPNIEIIVVDDSSTEDLSSITNTFKNTRIIRNNVSRGAQKSRLRGTEESKGEFVALLDSDDWWEPEKLQKQYEAFLANNPSLVSCQVNITNELRSGIIVPKQVFSGGQVANFLFADHGILQTSTFFSKKEILEDLLRKSADTKVHNDPSVVIECEKAEIAIVQLPEALTCCDFTVRGDRISLDPSKIEASREWFRHYGANWNESLKRSYLFYHEVPRLIACGWYAQALQLMIKNYSPTFSLKVTFKYILKMLGVDFIRKNLNFRRLSN